MKRIIVLLAVAVLLGAPAPAQESWKLPPPNVVAIVDAPPPPLAIMDHGHHYLVLVDTKALPPLEILAEPYCKLAGLRVNPRTNAARSTLEVTAATLLDISSGRKSAIALPAGYTFGVPEWSDDGRWLLIPATGRDGIVLWAAEIPECKLKQVLPHKLNPLLGKAWAWLPGGHLLVKTVPQDRGEPPAASVIPAGPRIQETSGKFARVSTYQDLLRNVHDEALFDFFAQAQIFEVDVAGGECRPVGKPGLYTTIDPAPGGGFLLVSQLHRPYSYQVPFSLFPQAVEIWNREGVPVKTLADLPLAEEIPMNGVRTGPRQVQWQCLQPATLVWVEALDKGDPKQAAELRDQIYVWPAPFGAEPRPLVRLKNRFRNLGWLQKPGNALLAEFDWKKEWLTVCHCDFSRSAPVQKEILAYNIKDGYNHPGTPLSMVSRRGEDLVICEGDWIYLQGAGASPAGERPFLDRFNLRSGAKKRLFHSPADRYESFVGFFGESRRQVIIRSEAKTEPPNYFLASLDGSKRTALTRIQDPAPELTRCKKELVSYRRADGLQLSGMLYLPFDFKPGERRPLVLWAYPLEYTDARTAGQVRGSENRFTYFRGASQLLFLTQGYVVLDNAQMPIVGDPETKNNTYLDQVVAAARAAVDYLNGRGLIDPRRVGVGGHSYGAFMTANLLAHSDLFAAGIARSGAYNRTLTPFGFQSERRSLWEAPEMYIRVSPFMSADRVKAPILLIHGEDDNNSGTFPIQSERFFLALKGFGATARLVMLPFESHGYQARESVLHVLAEMFDWFDRYVKNRK